MKCLFSVIIPIYNGERFVRQGIDRVLAQSYSDYELILVDDGSTDGSGTICDQYSGKYPQIKTIHKENGGISSARNAGIRAAEGEYIVFCDADDFLECEALEKLERVARTYSPDCICFDWQYVTSEGAQPPATLSLPKDCVLDRAFIHEIILPPLLNLSPKDGTFIFDYSVNKIYKRSIISQNHIFFDETRRIWEDRPFVVEYLYYCNSFYYLPCALYNYVQVGGSLSSKYYNSLFDITLANYRLYCNLFGNEYNFETQFAYDYWSRAISRLIYRALEESDADGTIREKMTETLQNPLVIEWYKNRKGLNWSERRISQLVVEGKTENAIKLHRYDTVINGWKHQCNKTVAKIKRIIKYMIK